MKAYLNRLATALIALVVAGGLAFGGSQALSSTTVSECDSPGEVAECPPHDDDSCRDLCMQMFQTHGECNPDGCCMCQL